MNCTVQLSTFAIWLIGIAGVYNIITGLVLTGANMQSKIILQVIPFLFGLGLVLVFVKAVGLF